LSPDDSRIAYLTNQDQKWQVWTLQAAAPETPAPLYTNNIDALQGWSTLTFSSPPTCRTHTGSRTTAKFTQTALLQNIYGSSFQIRDSDTIRVNPGNPDLLLVSANYATRLPALGQRESPLRRHFPLRIAR